jgi:hypothetical protein
VGANEGDERGGLAKGGRDIGGWERTKARLARAGFGTKGGREKGFGDGFE